MGRRTALLRVACGLLPFAQRSLSRSSLCCWRSASPEPDVAGVPSSLDQRLNAAARTCALTPRSEKALSCISQEFDQLFSQLATASDGAASQVSYRNLFTGQGSAPVLSESS